MHFTDLSMRKYISDPRGYYAVESLIREWLRNNKPSNIDEEIEFSKPVYH